MADEPRSAFARCSTCREPIGFEAGYYRCSVSTCNRKRAPLRFCSVHCWEVHLAEARHRDAWAEEDRAPTRASWERQAEQDRAERERREQRAAGREPRVVEPKGRSAHEVLVVGSKVKDYVRDRAGMSLSDRVFGVLSDHLRDLLAQAAQRAGRDGRKTVLDRDVQPLVARGGRAAVGEEEVVDPGDGDAIVIVSKLKKHVKTVSGMSTSDGVVPLLSAHLRHVLREAIRRAGADDRRTVLDRDAMAVLRPSA